MEYRQLYYFVCVAKEGNFTRAAEKLMISEPSLSKTIKRLEEELGCQLAVRSSRTFTLTYFGKMLYDRGLEVVLAFEELNDMAKKYAKHEDIEVKIGIPPVLNTVLAFCISRFISDYQHVKFSFIEEGSKVIKDLLLENKIDVGFAIRPVDDKYFDATDVISDRTVAIMSENHYLAGRTELDITSVKDEQLILLNSDYQIYHNIIKLFESKNLKPNIVSTSLNWDFIIEIISQSSKYITFLPYPIVEKIGKNIVWIPMKDSLLSWKVVAITRKGDYMPMIVKDMIQSIQSFYSCGEKKELV